MKKNCPRRCDLCFGESVLGASSLAPRSQQPGLVLQSLWKLLPRQHLRQPTLRSSWFPEEKWWGSGAEPKTLVQHPKSGQQVQQAEMVAHMSTRR